MLNKTIIYSSLWVFSPSYTSLSVELTGKITKLGVQMETIAYQN